MQSVNCNSVKGAKKRSIEDLYIHKNRYIILIYIASVFDFSEIDVNNWLWLKYFFGE